MPFWFSSNHLSFYVHNSCNKRVYKRLILRIKDETVDFKNLVYAI